MTEVVKQTDEVTLTIDGVEVTAPKGELVIRTAERMGIEIPRFCDHPLLAPAGACRQCLVDVEGQRKPVASCTQPVADGMVVRTHLTSEVAKKAQAGIMEMLLINHPLDCPMCDKGGECPLQNQAMSSGRADTRFHEHKREYPKPINISSQVLLDRERCVLCQRCTRFSEEIAGDPFIDLMDRSSAEQINVYREEVYGGSADGDEPFNSYFSGNTVQICPVGALTGSQYRFQARPFDLVSSPSVCEHCAAGCAQRTDHRRGKVMRRLAGEDSQVNEEWNCDKGRWGFQYANAFDRITEPLVRDQDSGELRRASWTEALAVAAEGLRSARDGAYGVGVLTGGRLTVEDAYAYAKFARVVLQSNDIDFRSRPHSAEEADFLAAHVVGETSVTYADLEAAPQVVVAGLEPEEECPIVFLRLRKAAAKGLRVTVVAPFLTRGMEKLSAALIPCLPGQEATALRDLDVDRETVILAGERLATATGAFSALSALAGRTGAKLAWLPRRAGDRGAVDTGCLPHLLPGGRPVGEAAGRAELAGAWGLPAGHLSSTPGRDTAAILRDAANGKLGALVVAGVDPADLANPHQAEQALDRVGFLVSLELRMSAVARRADVVFPVAVVDNKAGSYLNWEGRLRTFEQAFETPSTVGALPDARVLDALAAQLGVALGTASAHDIRKELGALPATAAPRSHPPTLAAGQAPAPDEGQAVLACWSQLLDLGTMIDGDEVLAGTARPAVVRLSKARAARLGVTDGDPVTVGTERGAITLPAALTDLADDVVWLPRNSPGSTVHRLLGVTEGAVVTVSGGKS